MKNLSKFMSLFLALFLVIGITACTQGGSGTTTSAGETTGAGDTTTGGSQASGAYTAGTYVETVQGHNGEMKVEVVFTADKIDAVKILAHEESPQISDLAIERIPQEIVDGQTLAVDTVSGATVSSTAILTAVEQAAVKAGADIAKLKENGGETAAEDVTLTTDVVVVGGGGAGLAAAASAQEHGAEVIVLEKLAQTGGSTALSGGGIAATGTSFQEERGIEDTKDSWMALWKERQATSNPDGLYPDYDFVDQFMDAAVVTTEWLHEYIKHEYGAVAGFGMDPVERLHFPKPEGDVSNGSIITSKIEGFITDKGAQVLTETAAKELIVDADGNVTGVIAEGKNGEVTINAKKVILAAGGFARSAELLEKWVPEAKETANMTMAGVGSTGDGIVMAEAIGAALYEEPWVIGLGIGARIPGTSSLMMDWSKLYVNTKGERYTNEQIHYAIATNKLIEQEGTWVIMDSSEANQTVIDALEAAAPSEEFVQADTFEDLAKAMGVPEETFLATMETYNAGAKAGEDALGKSRDFLPAVEAAPYYAVKFYPMTMGTFGGVKTNDSYQVLKADGSIIPNLYAAGENANKILYNQVYMSGSAVQFALTSGRIAGQHAAETLND